MGAASCALASLRGRVSLLVSLYDVLLDHVVPRRMDWLVREFNIGVRARTFVGIRRGLHVANMSVVTFGARMCEALPHRRKLIYAAHFDFIGNGLPLAPLAPV